MLKVNWENIEKQKETFCQLLGEEFIGEAEEYSQLSAQGKLKQQPKGYTPFFDFCAFLSGAGTSFPENSRGTSRSVDRTTGTSGKITRSEKKSKHKSKYKYVF